MSFNKKLPVLAAISLTISFMFSTAVFASIKGVVNADNVNVRSEATTSSETIGQVSTADDVIVYGVQGSFFKIKYGDQQNAFISKDYVTVSNAVGVVNDSDINVRAESNTTSTVLGKVQAGDKLTLTGKAGNFLLVDYNGKKAFVHQDYIDCAYKDNLPVVSEVASENNATTYAMVTVDSVLNMRSQASKDASVITKLYNGDVLDVVSNGSEWVKVRADNGTEGYVSAEFVSIRTGVKPSRSISSSSKGQEVVNYAKQFLGTPYSWGGTNLNAGVDCSGFVYAVYKNFGYSLNRTSSSMPSNGVKVSKSELIPGDLVFFSNGGASNIQHVGIYIGDNQFIHSASGRQWGVVISSLSENYYVTNYITAARVIR